MKSKLITIGFLSTIIISSLAGWQLLSSGENTVQTAAETEHADSNQAQARPPAIQDELILAATLQMVAFYDDQPENSQANILSIYECGLGTLVQVGNETLIVSHDHWNSLQEITRVQFQDVDGRLLAEISGNEFRQLIRYRDGGTMLLSIPPEIHPAYLAFLASRSSQKETRPILPGEPGDQQILQVGQIVAIAYRTGEGRNQVGLLPATIVDLSDEYGVVTFKLQSLDGTVILPGDSGGGIWLDGKLVGNMYLTEWVYDWRFWKWDALKPSQQYLDTSNAAQLPADFQSLFSNQDTSSLDFNFTDVAQSER